MFAERLSKFAHNSNSIRQCETSPPLRQFQVNIPNEACNAFAGGRFALAGGRFAPTGAGKSGVAVMTPFFLVVAPSLHMAR